MKFITLAFSSYGDLRMGGRGRDEYLRPDYVARIDGNDTVVVNRNPNVQRPTGYDQVNLMQKLRYILNDNWEIGYGFHYSRTSDVPRYDRLIERKDGLLRSVEWYYGPQKWMMNALNLKYAGEAALFDEAELVIACQKYEESRNDRKFGDSQLRTRVETVDDFSLNLYFFKRLNEKNDLFYGAELVTNSVGSEGTGTDIITGEKERISTRYPDGSGWSSYAVYANYKSYLSERLILVAGARYNQVILDAEFDKSYYPFPFDDIRINTGALTASLGLVFRRPESWQLNLSASTGFRAPNIDDVAKVFDSEPGCVVVPNENLKSEYAWNFDLGFTRYLYDRVQIEATGFYTILKNAMVRQDFSLDGRDYIVYDGELSRVQAVQNAEEAEIYGIQLGAFADIHRNLSLRANLNYTYGETRMGETLQHVPPTFGSAHLIFRARKFRSDLYITFNGEIPFSKLAPTERGKPHIYATDANGDPFSPGWFTLNLKASYQVNRIARLVAGIENILDRRYRPYSSGIAAPGRNLIVGLRYSF